MSAAPRRTGRSVLAVAVGFLTVAVLSTAIDQVLHSTGVYPPWGERMSDGLFGLALGYRLAITVLGGWVAARLAPSRPVGHAIALGLLGTMFALAGALVTVNRPDLGPAWYPIALVVTALPSVWLGGWLRERSTRPGGALA